MDKKRLIIAVIVIIFEIVIMAIIIRLMHPRAYDPVAIGEEKFTLDDSVEIEENVMKININNEEYVINVENETLMEELFNSLPEKFTMTELNGNEKYYYLNSNMKNANSEAVGQVQKGDVMLFGSDCLVIFYDSFETEFRYTILGHLCDKEYLGKGNVDVSITK